MKNVILATALVAMASTFASTGFAMDNPVNESRAKIERILASQKANAPVAPAPHVMTFSLKETAELDRYEAAKQRLFGDRSGPSGR